MIDTEYTGKAEENGGVFSDLHYLVPVYTLTMSDKIEISYTLIFHLEYIILIKQMGVA